MPFKQKKLIYDNSKMLLKWKALKAVNLMDKNNY